MYRWRSFYPGQLCLGAKGGRHTVNHFLKAGQNTSPYVLFERADRAVQHGSVRNDIPGRAAVEAGYADYCALQ
ncbi:hypothetical protein D3C87_1705120 [compost metagenome]